MRTRPTKSLGRFVKWEAGHVWCGSCTMVCGQQGLVWGMTGKTGGIMSSGLDVMAPEPTVTGAARGASANERFKARFSAYVWTSLIAATALHFLLLQFAPQFRVADVSFVPSEIEAVNLPPEIEIPPPPAAIPRPATPVVAAVAEISEDITIAPTTFASYPVEALPPPPPAEAVRKERDIAAAPTFTPYTVAPDLANRDEVLAALAEAYPRLLRDAGIGGSVLLWFFIDENGNVLDVRLNKGSGLQTLDAAALQVAHIYRFSPALNRDKRVKVWVQVPIVFSVVR